MNEVILDCSVKDREMARIKHIHFALRTVKGLIKTRGTIKPFKIKMAIVKVPPGGEILPYFKSPDGKWKIVLIQQYRPAINQTIMEAPGGKFDKKETPEKALSRELKEEAGIKVKAKSIRIVLREYVSPSLINAPIFGGIVRVNRKMVKDKKRAGKKSEHEETRVEVFDLIELLEKRELGLECLDLLTSRLIDEVAKAVGLLVKK